jgi:hypothetical protein
MQRLYRPLPEQARSHRKAHKRRYFAQPSLCFTWIDIERSPLNLVGVSLLAKTAFPPLKMQRLYRPLPEQARSHRKARQRLDLAGQYLTVSPAIASRDGRLTIA